MAQRATSLGPKPSLCFGVSSFFVFCLFVFFELTPPYFLFVFVFFFFFCFCFLCFPFFVFLIDKKPVFPLKKGIFCLFSVSPFVSL